MNSQNEYLASIDRRLSKIEEQTMKIQADLAGLKVRVAGVSAIVSMIIWSATKWLG